MPEAMTSLSMFFHPPLNNRRQTVTQGANYDDACTGRDQGQ